MPEHAFITYARARRPPMVKLLLALIIVLSVSGVAMAAYELTAQRVATRQTPVQRHRGPIPTTHRPRL